MVGVVLADGSAAVLASDSMTHDPEPGMPAFRRPTLRSKIRDAFAAGKLSGAYVASPEWAVSLELFIRDDSIGYAMGTAPVTIPDPPRAAPDRRGWWSSPQLIFACWTAGSRVALGYSSEPRECRLAGGSLGHGAIFTGGTSKIWAREVGYVSEIPQTVADAERAVAEIASKTIEWWYREDGCQTLNDYLARGTLPPIALPVLPSVALVATYDTTTMQVSKLTLQNNTQRRVLVTVFFNNNPVTSKTLDGQSSFDQDVSAFGIVLGQITPSSLPAGWTYAVQSA